MFLKKANKPGIQFPWSWISPMFSALYFLSFFFSEVTGEFILISLLLYATFLALYTALIVFHRDHAPLFIVAMTLLAVFGSDINSSSNIFFSYAALFSGLYFSKLRASIAVIVIILSVFVTAYCFNLFYAYYFFPALVPTIGLVFVGAMIQQTEIHLARDARNAEEKRQLAKVAERERIARDLHDTVGHNLSSIALKAQLAKKLGDKGQMASALEEIDSVAKLASETLGEVRQAITGYRKKGLYEQLMVLQSRLDDAGFTVSSEGTLDNLTAIEETALILMMTEAVTNILRHSKGNHVEIQLSSQTDGKSIRIWDNGVVASFTPGNGLSGMKERLQSLGGTLLISTDDGFSLTLNLPDDIKHD